MQQFHALLFHIQEMTTMVSTELSFMNFIVKLFLQIALLMKNIFMFLFYIYVMSQLA